MSQRMISVRSVDGVRQVQAWCVGHIAAHALLTYAGPALDKFNVTHLPSGICFAPEFATREAAIAAASEINALRDDWAAFDPRSVTDEFKAALRAIYRRHGGVMLPPVDGDRRRKLALQNYATDFNGYVASEKGTV